MLDEAKLERWARSQAMQRGGLLIKVQGIGLRGFPDRLLALDGRLRLMEFKSEYGRLSESQKSVIRRLAACGIEVPVIRSKEAFLDELRRTDRGTL